MGGKKGGREVALNLFWRSGVWGRQASLTAMLPHLLLLMGQNAEIRTRFTCAEQYKTGVSIRRIVTSGIRLIDFAAIQQPSRTSEASSLMTESRQRDARGQGGVPDMLVRAHGDSSFPVWQ